MFTYFTPRTSGVNTASDADDATKRNLEVKKEMRERQDCQCAGWVHSPPVDPETKRCGWHPPTAERPSPEIEGAWRLEKATEVMDNSC